MFYNVLRIQILHFLNEKLSNHKVQKELFQYLLLSTYQNLQRNDLAHNNQSHLQG